MNATVRKFVKRGQRRRAKKNPPLRKYGAAKLIGMEVYEIRYRHAKDGTDYRHPMETNVILLGMPDGSLRLESTEGHKLWKVFNV
jgi:hypothetical protein